MDLEGENLPKATIQQFIKETTKNQIKCSNDFIMSIMSLAKEYIHKVSDESNQICLDQGKKTISGEFFFMALEKLNVQGQRDDLMKIEQEVQDETTVTLIEVKNQQKARFHDEDNLKELENQQRILFENAKNENLSRFQQIEDEENKNLNGDHVYLFKEKRRLNLSVFDSLDQE